MNKMKFSVCAVSLAMLLSSCGMSNTAKGGIIGGAGVLIGNKMDKSKKAAELANAEAEVLTDKNGTQYVKATFDSGLLFNTGSATLSASAQAAIKKFVTNLSAEDNTFDLAICGFTDNAGWKNSTAEQSAQKNIDLSQKRAGAVSSYLTQCGVNATQIKSVTGMGEANPVADNSTAAGQAQNRRVEVYLYASEAMIQAAQAQVNN